MTVRVKREATFPWRWEATADIGSSSRWATGFTRKGAVRRAARYERREQRARIVEYVEVS